MALRVELKAERIRRSVQSLRRKKSEIKDRLYELGRIYYSSSTYSYKEYQAERSALSRELLRCCEKLYEAGDQYAYR